MRNVKPIGQSFTTRHDLDLPFSISGVVVRGDQRGRELGYPTANIEAPQGLVAPEGVFAGTARRANGTIFRSAISIGRRETFYLQSGPSLVEAYLLDFAGDLYDEILTVHIITELRPQTRFLSIESLIAQIERDVEEVRQIVDLSRDEPCGLDPTTVSR